MSTAGNKPLEQVLLCWTCTALFLILNWFMAPSMLVQPTGKGEGSIVFASCLLFLHRGRLFTGKDLKMNWQSDKTFEILDFLYLFHLNSRCLPKYKFQLKLGLFSLFKSVCLNHTVSRNSKWGFAVNTMARHTSCFGKIPHIISF